jgi:hypothetical protein
MNRYQVIASVIIILIAMVFVYVYIFYPIVHPLKQNTVLNNKLIVIAPHNYEAISFSIPDTFGREEIKAQFQVLNSNSTAGISNNEGTQNERVNALIADSLDQFECKRQQHFASLPGVDASTANNSCTFLATVIKYQILNATAGVIDQPIRYGNYYLVFDNTDSNSSVHIKANLLTLTDMPLTFPPTSDD